MKDVCLMLLIIASFLIGYYVLSGFDHHLSIHYQHLNVLIITNQNIHIDLPYVVISASLLTDINYDYIILFDSYDLENLINYTKIKKYGITSKVYSRCNDQENINLYIKENIDLVENVDELKHLLEHLYV